MLKSFSKISVLWQYLLPQQALSILSGYFADSTQPWLKNFLIKRFIKNYKINMEEALIENPKEFPNFNSFFIRRLKSNIRPIDTDKKAIVSPVDGSIAQFGMIEKGQLLQAKGDYFDLTHLLGELDEAYSPFHDGHFAIFYLAPHNYHRVHMPIDGQLMKTIYVPGKLFSVNQLTARHISKLYARNERLVTLFDTVIGKMAVILVGAMIVGHIETVWAPVSRPIRRNKIKTDHIADSVTLNKGDELGYFKLGSTVILLFEKNKMTWDPKLVGGQSIFFGKKIGNFSAGCCLN